MREEYTQESTAVDFQAYRIPLETVTIFEYLGRVLTAPYYDWLTVVDNPRKALSRWSY